MRSATQTYARLYESCRGKPEELDKFWSDLRTDRQNRTVVNSDFSIRQLAENFWFDSHGDRCGREILENWKGGNTGDGPQRVGLTEAAGPVERSAFSNITGQIVYNEVMDAWNQPGYIADSLVTNVPTAFLDGERIPGISVVGDDAEVVGEGQPYPYSGLSEQYVDTPPPLKRGHIVSLTMESLIADRTGQILQRANTVTNSLRINKEKRVLDTALGITTSWKRNSSSATGTYLDSTTKPHDFDNLAASNALADWTDVEAALLLFDGMTDPDIGEPITVVPTTVVVPSGLLMTAARILNATFVDERTGVALAAGATTDSDRTTRASNPVGAMALTTLSNAYVASRVGNSTTWFVGDFAKAFRYMEVRPITMVQAPTNNEMEFTRDIVEQFKVNEYGVPAVVEPRYVVKNTA